MATNHTYLHKSKLRKEGKNQNKKQNKKDLYGVCHLCVLDRFSLIASCLSTKVKKGFVFWFDNLFSFSLVFVWNNTKITVGRTCFWWILYFILVTNIYFGLHKRRRNNI
ncbi:hypothetical protein K1719_045815 [Acacia pycnantha]|nr:hypothetical protein K1719_045815 [Acacia pycnantha]